MNPSEDEINLLLPLTFGLVIVFFSAILGLIIWTLNKTQIINTEILRALFDKDSQLFDVLRAAILSVVGVFIIFGISGVAGVVVQIIKSFFAK